MRPTQEDDGRGLSSGAKFRLKRNTSSSVATELPPEKEGHAAVTRLVMRLPGRRAGQMREDAPYARPDAFMPLNAYGQMSLKAAAAKGSGQQEAALYVPLRHFQCEAASLVQALRTEVMSIGEAHGELLRLAKHIDHAHAVACETLKHLVRAHTRKTSTSSLKAFFPSQAPEEVRGYDIYDMYFIVIRVARMNAHQLACQVTATSLKLLNDLPFTTLGIGHIIAAIDAMEQMFEILAPSCAAGTNPGDWEQSEGPPKDEGPHQRAWSQARSLPLASRGDWTRQVASHRWCSGHHFYNLCAFMASEQLECALAKLELAPAEEIAEVLVKVAKLIRGMTAGMCYASDFPGETYRNFIRPSMIMTETPHGFSGLQNTDYSRMKAAKKRFTETLFSRLGRTPRDWPSAIYYSVRELHEADLQDLEHHVLLAASKVGADSSLAQKVWQARLPSGSPVKNAVDVLRDMAEMRRREYVF